MLGINYPKLYFKTNKLNNKNNNDSCDIIYLRYLCNIIGYTNTTVTSRCGVRKERGVMH